MFDNNEDKNPIIGKMPKRDEDVKIPGGYYNLATGAYEIPDTSSMLIWRDMERALGVIKPVNNQIH
jgi:hypothetical protein